LIPEAPGGRRGERDPGPVGIREPLVVILRVLQDAHRQLLQVALARRLARVLAGAREDREKDRRENGYDGDDDE